MALKSPRFASNTALQNAARSAPPIRRGASGQHVIAIQQAFIDLGLGMGISTKKTASRTVSSEARPKAVSGSSRRGWA